MKKNIGKKEIVEKKVSKAVRKELVNNHAIRGFKGDIRKNILDVVRGDECNDPIEESEGIDPYSPTDILNQLILDYFKWMNFKYSTEMFAIESGTKTMLSRKKIRAKFKNSDGFSKNMPLLLELMSRRNSTKNKLLCIYAVSQSTLSTRK